jgi:hypothetical protein
VRAALRPLSTKMDVEANLGMLSAFHTALYCQSWTKLAESDALWRTYAYQNMAVRIEAHREDVPELIGVTAHDVDHVASINLEDELKRIVGSEGRTLQLARVLTTKRAAFSHEQEVRLVSGPDLENVEKLTSRGGFPSDTMAAVLRTLRGKGEVTEAELQESLKNLRRRSEPISTFKTIDLENVPGFVRSVMLHPMAPAWFDATLATYCALSGIQYSGKSKLYELHIT